MVRCETVSVKARAILVVDFVLLALILLTSTIKYQKVVQNIPDIERL